jgi:hypothetical protein
VPLEDKLLFIWYYVKAYPLQEIIAFALGRRQSTAHAWIPLLSAVLKKALADEGYLPERSPPAFATGLTPVPPTVYGRDGTERRRQRPRDPVQQVDYARGKKNRLRSSLLFLETSRRARAIM